MPPSVEDAWKELVSKGSISPERGIHPHTVYELEKLLERLRKRHRREAIEQLTLAQAFSWGLG